jgi:hypothetical protein
VALLRHLEGQLEGFQSIGGGLPKLGGERQDRLELEGSHPPHGLDDEVGVLNELRGDFPSHPFHVSEIIGTTGMRQTGIADVSRPVAGVQDCLVDEPDGERS